MSSPARSHSATSKPLADKPEVEQAEVGLAGALAKTRSHPAAKAAGKVAKLGDQEPLYAAAGAFILVGLLVRRPRVALAGVRIGTAVAVSDVAKSLIKRGVTRSRPKAAVDAAYESTLGGSDDKAKQSFPSGHMAATTGAALALTKVYPHLAPESTLAVIGLGVARVARGEHWPSDIAAGALIGWAADKISGSVIDWALSRVSLGGASLGKRLGPRKAIVGRARKPAVPQPTVFPGLKPGNQTR